MPKILPRIKRAVASTLLATTLASGCGYDPKSITRPEKPNYTSVNAVDSNLLKYRPTPKKTVNLDLSVKKLNLIALNMGLNPEVSKILLFKFDFDTNGVLNSVNLNELSRIAGRKISRSELFSNPEFFLKLNFRYLKSLYLKYKGDLTSVFTEYFFGVQINKRKFEINKQKVADFLRKYHNEYDSKLTFAQYLEYAKDFLRTTEFSISKYDYMDLKEFDKLSKENKVTQINSFLSFACANLNLDFRFMRKLLISESNYNHYAINKSSGATGLMQLTYDTVLTLKQRGLDFEKVLGRKIIKKDLFDPYINLSLGLIYFKYLTIRLNDNYDNARLAYKTSFNSFLKSKK